MTRNKANRLAVITGAAEGIGQAYAQRMAQDGHDIIVVDRLPAEHTRELVIKAGRSCHFLQCELSDPVSIGQVVNTIGDDFGGCDILINNAGIGSQRSFDAIDYAAVRQLLAVNVEAPFILTQGLISGMSRRGWGRIVNITTGALNLSLGGFVDYLMSKGALLGFTRALASEVGALGITVNAIAPGLVRTPMTLGGRDGHAPLPEFVFEMVTGMQSIKRSQLPTDLVGTMSFLTSDDAAFMTGQVLYCDGGVVRP